MAITMVSKTINTGSNPVASAINFIQYRQYFIIILFKIGGLPNGGKQS